MLMFLSLHHLIHFQTKYVQPLGGSSVDSFSAIKITALGRPQFLVGTTIVIKISMHIVNLTDTLAEGMWWTDIFFSFFFKATVLRGPGEMAAIFHLPRITAGKR